MPMLKAVIIDDEVAAQRSLEILLESNCPNISIVGKGFSVSEGITIIRETDPDIVFLDIEMPQGNGFELLEKLPDHKFQVIFITAYNQYAVKAFKYSAIDYILKPIDIDELVGAVNKVSEQQKSNIDPRERYAVLFDNLKEIIPRKLVIPGKEKYSYVDLNMAVTAQVEKDKITFTLNNGNVTEHQNTNPEIESLLAQKGFIMVKSRVLVNLGKVMKFQKSGKGVVILEGGKVVELELVTKDEFIEQLTAYNKDFGD